jgi:hypothetical protein
MSTIVLPGMLHDKLALLARRLAWLRLARYVGSTIAVLAGATLVTAAVDALVELPRVFRLCVLVFWLVGACFAIVRGARLWRQQYDSEALAALIESAYPNLAERLTTSVELAESSEKAHGSPILIDLLLRETEIRSSRLDFLQAAPEKTTRRRMILGAVAVMLLVAPWAIWPQTYAQKVRRLAMPWLPDALDYQVRYSQDDVVIARGSPLSLAAHLVASQSDARLPERAYLVMVNEKGQTKRLSLTSEAPRVFQIRLNEVTESFTYRIEAGRASGEERRVLVVDPIRLQPNSPTVLVCPPEYARAEPLPPERGILDLSCLQYSRLRFEYRFDQPAQKAWVTWVGEDAPGGRTHDLELSPDARSASFEMTAVHNGRLLLTIVGDHDIRTEVPGQAIHVNADRPPTFVKAPAIGQQLRVVSPDDQLELDIVVGDDIGVGEAQLEYRVNSGPIEVVPIPLQGVGTPQAQGRLVWKLADLGKDGETVQFRIRATDNRHVPEVKLGPQVVYAPAESRWFAVKLARNAQPLKQQEITAQREEIRNRLNELIGELNREQRRVYKARVEANQAPRLSPDVAEQLRDLRQEHSRNEKLLADLTRDVDQITELRSLAHRLQDVSDQEMRQAANALSQAQQERQAALPRDEQLGQADQSLQAAVKKLEELKKENDRLAGQRQDRSRVQQLAEKQRRLAEETAEELAPARRKQLVEEQVKIENELRELARSSEALKQAWEAARAEQAQQLAEKARELAHQQRELSQAIDQAQKELLRGELEALAERQKQLAERADKLALDSRQAVAAALSRPLETEDARDAARELEKGNVLDALTKQEQSAQELDRWAKDLQRALDLARDPREAVKQLARWQRDLKNRMVQEAKEAAPDKVEPDRLQAWQNEQDAVRQAIGRLPVPNEDTEARRERQAALQHATRAMSDLARGETESAAERMEKANQSLERLADRLPNLHQRFAEAREEIRRLRREQEDLLRQTEQAASVRSEKQTNLPRNESEVQKRFADAERKQAEMLDRLSRLNLPGFEARQFRAEQTMARALSDLKAGRPSDAAISQAEAKRHLERLEQALSGQQPVDEKVAELARRQRSLADRAAQAQGTPEANADRERLWQQLAAEQSRLAQEVAVVPPTEATQRHQQAVESVRRAENQARQNAQEFVHQASRAAKQLDDWAKQLSSGEDDVTKADRLAKSMRELSQQSRDRKPGERPADELQKKQAAIQEEARQIRGGEKAEREKQEAAEALAQLLRVTSDDLAKAQHQAAEALERLAEKLASSNPSAASREPADSGVRSVQDLAREQHRLVADTQRSRREAARVTPERANQMAQELARRQAGLREQASRILPDSQDEGRKTAQSAMRQAERALDRGEWEQAEQQLNAAARALERLAQTEGVQASREAPSGLPQPDQVDQARQLAQEQREIRDAVQQVLSKRANQDREAVERQLRDLTREQQRIAEEASDLARRQVPESRQAQRATEASRSARQAGQQLLNGAFDPARQSGEQASEQWRRFAQSAEGADSRDAEQLAKRQDAVNQRMAQLLQDPAFRQAQQVLRQQELQRQTQQLAAQLARQAEQTEGSVQDSLRQAAQAAGRANNLMQQAQQRQQEGNASGRRVTQQLAARDLDRAAQWAQRASGQRANEEQAPASVREMGSALRQAQAQMQEARGQLGQGQPQQARQAMESAARSLQQAARAGDSRNPAQLPRPAAGEPLNDGSATGAAIDLSRYGPDATRFKGKPWGELPGELRSRIIQDLKAQFGEDYGRMIKLYFEQLADRTSSDRK